MKMIGLSVLIVPLAFFSIGCTAKPEVVDGAAYAKYPKADIISKMPPHDGHQVLVACDKDSKARILIVVDTTILGVGSAWVEQEMELPFPCGAALDALHRLAGVEKSPE